MLKGLYVTQPNTLVIPSSTPDLLDSEFWGVCEVDGLGRPDATTYTTDRVGTDASFWSGLTVKSRKITLSVDAQADIYKMQLYKLLGYGEKRRMFFETDTGTYWIDGYTTGMKYTASPSAVSEFEIPFYCPYPWFRSAQYHEQPITYGGGSVSVSQNGDVCAGVEMYLPSTFVGVLAQFGLSSSDGTSFEYGSDEYQHLNGSSTSPVLLADTTPGNHRFLVKKAIRDIALTNGWCTVPTIGTTAALTATITTVSGINFDTTADGFLRWHDTFTGI